MRLDMKKYLFSLLTFIPLINLSVAQSFPDNQMLNDLQKYSNQTIECSEFSCNSINQISFDLNQQEIIANLKVSSRKNSFLSLPFKEEEIKLTSILIDNKIWYQVLLDNTTFKIVVPSGEHIITVKFIPKSNYVSLNQKIPNINVSSSLSLDERNGSSLISIKQAQKEDNIKDNIDKSNYPTEAFYQVSRHLFLNNSWKLMTTITPLFETNKNTILEIPLLKGEKILSSDIKVDNNKAIVSVSNQALSWESSLSSVNQLDIPSVQSDNYNQIFSLDSSNIWQYTIKGKNPFSIQGDTTSWSLWNGESLTLEFKAPSVLLGKTLSLHDLHIHYRQSHDTDFYDYSLSADTSLAGKTFFNLPDKLKIENLIINNQNINIDKNSKKIPVDLHFGKNSISFSLSADDSKNIFKIFPHVKFSEPVYNVFYDLSSNNWILYSGGANINTEYILFSSLIILLIISFFTKKINSSLNIFVIAFILFGFLQNSLSVMFLLPLLLGLIKFKDLAVKQFEKNHNSLQYNSYQFALIISSVAFLISFLVTLKLGLLDSPSSWTLYDSHIINWFNELYNSKPIWYIEIDSTFYHIIMFIWAIFVSYHLVNISKLAFKSIFSFELWIKKQTVKPIVESIENHNSIATSNNQINNKE
jgi:hypothetical protein